jgi:hypothetical protein
VKVKSFGFSVAPQRDSVIVLGGGPSVTRHRNQILDYASKNGSLVLSANYAHDWIRSDYTHFVTNAKLREWSAVPRSPTNVIVRDEMLPLKIENLGKHKFYVICNQKAKTGAYFIKSLEMSPKGRFDYFNLGNAGFSALILSVVFQPQKVLAVGFDGPSLDFTYKYNLNNERVAYPPGYNRGRGKGKAKYFRKVLLPFILSRGIELESFQTDRFWGVPKDKLGVKAINAE